MKNKIKYKGFTLIELLVTILIVALIFGVATYFITNFLSKGKETSNKITLNSILSTSIRYV